MQIHPDLDRAPQTVPQAPKKNDCLSGRAANGLSEGQGPPQLTSDHDLIH